MGTAVHHASMYVHKVHSFSLLITQTGPASFSFGTDESSTHTNEWSFGDGRQVNAPVGEMIPHTYDDAGTYTVEVTCHGTTTSQQVTAGVNPVATYRVAVLIQNREVTIQVLTGTPGRRVNYSWGDGQSGDLTLDDAGHGEISHTYQADGSYEVVSRDKDTNQVIRRRTIIVPTNFDADRLITYGHDGMSYEFLLLGDDWSPVLGDDVFWYFGDGATAESISDVPVMHTFGTYGPYQVTCTWGSNAERLLLDVVSEA